ncbi:MAG: 4-(cytidine 5'-diphospho)-2-C-methyl-D-erythritol kinase [Kiloniellaceae bacterium]
MAARAAPGVALRRHAWAKVNLTLHVTGRRADGFHELDSLVVFAGIGDRLELAPAADLTLAVEGPFAAELSPATVADETGAPGNLVLRAAEALRAAFGVTAGAFLRLDKQLPVAAGLGGGSADAAAAFGGLAELWGLGLAEAELHGLAAGLGADVPVCLVGRPSFVGGVGNEVSPAPPLPPAWLVLVNPGVALPTPAVYAARRGAFSRPRRWSDALADAMGLAGRLAACGNDLESAARAIAPQVGEVSTVLGATAGCLLARMSGSGATCFGLYADRDQAEAAAAAIQAARPAWWIRAAPMLRDRQEGPV